MFALALVSGLAAAKTSNGTRSFHGTVAKIAKNDRSLTINRTSGAQVRFVVRATTTYEHISGLSGLSKGTPVEVKAFRSDDRWIAIRIEGIPGAAAGAAPTIRPVTITAAAATDPTIHPGMTMAAAVMALTIRLAMTTAVAATDPTTEPKRALSCPTRWAGRLSCFHHRLGAGARAVLNAIGAGARNGARSPTGPSRSRSRET